MRLTPPIVAAGIRPMRQANLGLKLSTMAKQAARRMTAGSNTLVRLSTPVFSPYVVLAGAPNTEARNVARPSPQSVRCRPGSLMKFLPTVLWIAHMSPMCSMIVAKAIGKMAMIDVTIRSKLGSFITEIAVRSISIGRPIHATSLSLEKSTSPIAAARIYDPTTPSRIGTILMMPLPQIDVPMTIAMAVTASSQFC